MMQASPPQENQESADTNTFQYQDNNVATKLDEQELAKIGSECKAGFDADEATRMEWLQDTQEWLALAKQVREDKVYPWPGASNIKYPLISTAALQFSARAYPTLVPSDGKIVKSRVIGPDPTGEKAKLGERVATYMSWQLTEDMDYWEEEFDRLLISLAVCGVMFRKTYYDSTTDKIESRMVYPENFVVDYWSKNLDETARFSEIIYLDRQKVESHKRSGDYLNVDLGDPSGGRNTDRPNENPLHDWTDPYKIIKQYTWLDLDDDGLREPYIVTFEYDSAKILRIEPRFGPKDIILNPKTQEIVGYKAFNPFTKYSFIPNPDGSFYDLGFGHLLGPLNESANTIVNQLVDSGTINNLQSGFIGKGLRLKMGTQALQPGEWRAVNATGDDLRKQIVPLPGKEPSGTLLKLLELLITSGKELASVAEIFVGKMPGQNTPATTTMASIEQGMKVFTAIYKRVYRSLDRELAKVFSLNSTYLDEQTFISVMDEPINPGDFNYDRYDVCPTADPNATSQQEKVAKAQALLELMQSGLLDPMKVMMRVLEAQQQPNWQELIPGMAETGQPAPPQQKPDPKVMAIQEKAKIDQGMAQMRMQEAQAKQALEAQSEQQRMAIREREHQQDIAHKEQINRLKARAEAAKVNIQLAGAQQSAVIASSDHVQAQRQREDLHKQKLQQSKETSKSKSQKKNSPNGGNTGSRGK